MIADACLAILKARGARAFRDDAPPRSLLRSRCGGRRAAAVRPSGRVPRCGCMLVAVRQRPEEGDDGILLLTAQAEIADRLVRVGSHLGSGPALRPGLRVERILAA